MKRYLAISLLALLLGIFATAVVAPAQTPDITITLAPIGSGAAGEVVADVTITNNYPNQYVLISAGFQARDNALDFRIISPARQWIPAVSYAPSTEWPDRPPTVFDYVGDQLVEFGPCEVLPSGYTKSVHIPDLRAYYRLDLAGLYSAQVQIPVRVYAVVASGAPAPPCDTQNALWTGTLVSNIQDFYMGGATTVTITPSTWLTAWTDPLNYLDQTLQVRVDPPAGVSVAEYMANTVSLNGVPAASTQQPGGTNYLLATFSKYKAITTLGTLQPGDTRPVIISGLLRSGRYFGGSQTVTIAAAAHRFEGFFSPVANPTVINEAKVGQTIPVKWRLTNAAGPVNDPASFMSLSSYGVDCGGYSGNPIDAIEEYASGASGLQALGDGYWQYNWKTPKAYAGTCRVMILTLSDGTVHKAVFRFK